MIAFLHIFGTVAVSALVALTVCIYVNVRKGNLLTMSLAEDLNTAVVALKAKDDLIIALVTSQNTTIANLNAAIVVLQGQINTGGVDPVAVQSAIDSLNTEAQRIAAALPTT